MKVRAGGLAILVAIGVVALTAGGAGAKQAACGTVTLNQQALTQVFGGAPANTGNTGDY